MVMLLRDFRPYGIIFSLSLKVSDGVIYKIIKLQRFGSWILLPSSDKKGGKRTERLSVGPPG
jgi:hypothetical protein